MLLIFTERVIIVQINLLTFVWIYLHTFGSLVFLLRFWQILLGISLAFLTLGFARSFEGLVLCPSFYPL